MNGLFIRVIGYRVDLVTDYGQLRYTVYNGTSSAHKRQAISWWREQGYEGFVDVAAVVTSGGNGAGQFFSSIGWWDRKAKGSV